MPPFTASMLKAILTIALSKVRNINPVHLPSNRPKPPPYPSPVPFPLLFCKIFIEFP